MPFFNRELYRANGGRPHVLAAKPSASFALRFRGLAAPFNALTSDDRRVILAPGAFRKTLAERGQSVKLLLFHNAERPVGRILAARETSDGLMVEAGVIRTRDGEDAAELVKTGTVSGLSVGFDAIREEVVKDAAGLIKAGVKDPAAGLAVMHGGPVRVVREARLYEVSLVAWPAFDAAGVEAEAWTPAEPWRDEDEEPGRTIINPSPRTKRAAAAARAAEMLVKVAEEQMRTRTR